MCYIERAELKRPVKHIWKIQRFIIEVSVNIQKQKNKKKKQEVSNVAGEPF
jgi:hypothetical protein